jgi:hypothetical protein
MSISTQLRRIQSSPALFSQNNELAKTEGNRRKSAPFRPLRATAAPFVPAKQIENEKKRITIKAQATLSTSHRETAGTALSSSRVQCYSDRCCGFVLIATAVVMAVSSAAFAYFDPFN